MAPCPHVLFPKQRLTRAGGLEKQLFALMRGFARAGFEVSLATHQKDPHFPLDPGCPFNLIELPVHGFTRASRQRSFEKAALQWLETHPASIIFGIERTRIATHLRLGDGTHAQYLKNRKMLLPHYLLPKHRSILALEKEAFGATRCLITNSHMVAHELKMLYQVDPKKILTVHNGVEWEKFAPAFENRLSVRAQMRSSLGIKAPIIALFVGHDFARKGLFLILESLKRRPDIHLLVVGKDSSESHYRRKAARLGIQVSFIGSADPIPYYQTADLFLLPTFYDPCANTTLEALAMGLFVITSPSNGASELLTPVTGAILTELTSKSLTQALLEHARSTSKERAQIIRDSVQTLTLDRQIDLIINNILTPIQTAE